MSNSRLSQFQVNFLLLLNTPREEWVAAHDFGRGDVSLSGQWYFMSYKNPARCSDVYSDIGMESMYPVVERKEVKGKSGAKYYEYRIKPSERNIERLRAGLPQEYIAPLMRFKNN